MKEKFNVSFKLDKPRTGLDAVGNSKRGATIRVNKKSVGYIDAPNWQTDDQWRVSIRIVKKDINEDGNTNCPWRHWRFKRTFDTYEDACEFLKRKLHQTVCLNELTLHFFEDE